MKKIVEASQIAMRLGQIPLLLRLKTLQART